MSAKYDIWIWLWAGVLVFFGGCLLGGGGAPVVSIAIGPAVHSMLCQLFLAGMFGLFGVLGCVGVRGVGFCFRVLGVCCFFRRLRLFRLFRFFFWPLRLFFCSVFSVASSGLAACACVFLLISAFAVFAAFAALSVFENKNSFIFG